MLKAKILHIWNTAGVASILAKYTDRLFPAESQVLMKKSYDVYGLTITGQFLPEHGDSVLAKAEWFSRCLWKCRRFDVVHIHGLYRAVPLIKLLFPCNNLVYHAHGSDVRRIWRKRWKYLKFANLIFCSTNCAFDKDTPQSVVYCPNPVDRDLFNADNRVYVPNSAFTFSLDRDSDASEYALAHGLRLVIHNRDREPIPYVQMGSVLQKFEYYLDFKKHDGQLLFESRDKYSFSKTALEALACGCKVIGGDLKVYKGLPVEHDPENVASFVWNYYVKTGFFEAGCWF